MFYYLRYLKNIFIIILIIRYKNETIDYIVKGNLDIPKLENLEYMEKKFV